MKLSLGQLVWIHEAIYDSTIKTHLGKVVDGTDKDDKTLYTITAVSVSSHQPPAVTTKTYSGDEKSFRIVPADFLESQAWLRLNTVELSLMKAIVEAEANLMARKQMRSNYFDAFTAKSFEQIGSPADRDELAPVDFVARDDIDDLDELHDKIPL